MQDLATVLTSLSVAAGLALGVERTLEVLKHFMESENGFLSARDRSEATKQAEKAVKKARQAIDAVVAGTAPVSSGAGPKEQTAVSEKKTLPSEDDGPNLTADSEGIEKFPPPQIAVLPATQQATFDTAKILFFHLAAAGLGMILASIFDLGLLAIFLKGSELSKEAWFKSLDIMMTGFVIGGGSQPIHILIRFLTEHKITVDVDKPAPAQDGKVITATLQPLTGATKATVETAWIEIDYKGGINPEQLEDAHLRPADPNLIVYHHTAMASFTSFQQVVDEFLVNKKWLTGYHCVIMPDGAIRPFCRWDRYGNHAKGLNARSLGIAFHGNFHLEPGDKYGNADGRYGNRAPTEAQLRAGARVVTLWTFLYDDIRLDFDTCILPHNLAIAHHTVCPGSNFPTQAFHRLVRQYHEAWAQQEIAQTAIKQFKERNYIYV